MHTQARTSSPAGIFPKAAVGLRRTTGRTSLYLIACLSSILFMGPFIWTLFSSLKPFTEIYLFPPTLFPKQWEWSNYPLACTLQPIGRWMLNSVFITVISLIGVLFSGSLVAYSFSKFSFPGRDFLFTVTLATMMLPSAVTLIPRYLLFHRMHWLNTYLPLIVPAFFGGGAFNIFLLRQFFLSLPNELNEAAIIDGASSFKVLYSILLPLSKPALATVSVIYILWSWDNFMEPLIYLDTPNKFPIAVGIKYFQRAGPGAHVISAGKPIEQLLMAVAVMMTAPIVVLFFLAQQYFVQGVVMSGIKG
jgi:multiple sugar transport system permease protein